MALILPDRREGQTVIDVVAVRVFLVAGDVAGGGELELDLAGRGQGVVEPPGGTLVVTLRKILVFAFEAGRPSVERRLAAEVPRHLQLDIGLAETGVEKGCSVEPAVRVLTLRVAAQHGKRTAGSGNIAYPAFSRVLDEGILGGVDLAVAVLVLRCRAYQMPAAECPPVGVEASVFVGDRVAAAVVGAIGEAGLGLLVVRTQPAAQALGQVPVPVAGVVEGIEIQAAEVLVTVGAGRGIEVERLLRVGFVNLDAEIADAHLLGLGRLADEELELRRRETGRQPEKVVFVPECCSCNEIQRVARIGNGMAGNQQQPRRSKRAKASRRLFTID